MKFVIIFVLLIPSVLAQNITINYPESICIGEEFNLEIKWDTYEIYDIKIDILKEGERITRIWDGSKWASTMYYIKEGFDGEESFKFKAEKSGEADIIVKLRKDDIIEFTGTEIRIDKECINTNEDYSDSESKKNLYNRGKEPLEEKIKYFNKTSNKVKIANPIILTPQTIKTDNGLEKVDRSYGRHIILLFCLALGVLYFKDFIKKKNEFK